MGNDLDRILENAVKSYAAVEPSPELAGRILQKAQQHGPSPRREWKLVLAFALPLPAALALVFVLAGQWALPKPPQAIASVPSTPHVAIHPHLQPAETRKPAREHAREAHSIRSAARPLPPFYSREELTLLSFVQQYPKEAAEIAKAQKQDMAPLSTQPITICHLEIKPLAIAPLHQEN